MKLSAGVEWGVHCCVVLSQAVEPVPAARLAEFHGISRTYLAKHLQQLSRAGIVRSTEGRVGGYELTRDAKRISVLDVVRAIDGDESAFRCTEIRQNGPLGATPQECLRPCGVARVMAAAEKAWQRSLAGVSVADLAQTFDEESGRTALTALRGWLGEPSSA
jgi:Rrf2 family protein